MEYDTQNFISPNFRNEKLESPTYEDLLDVFEDRMRNWFLLPAKCLLEIPHCQIAAVALLIAYFEGIQIYLSGEDSKNRSFDFFSAGLAKVFSFGKESQDAINTIARAIYGQARCGFAHDGMFRNRLFFSEVRPEPLNVTFPKKIGGELDLTQVESILINPFRLYESIQTHFEQYLADLRNGTDKDLKNAFEATVKLKWALDEPDRAIGMSEKEFYET